EGRVSPLALAPESIGGRLEVQAVAALATAGYSFAVTLVLVKLLDLTVGLTLSARAEEEGLDRSEHGEAGFDLGPDTAPATEVEREPRPAAAPPPAGPK